jgi:hypothetical protein
LISAGLGGAAAGYSAQLKYGWGGGGGGGSTIPMPYSERAG